MVDKGSNPWREFWFMRLKILFIAFIITSVVLSIFVGLRYNSLRDQLFALPHKLFVLSQNTKNTQQQRERSSISLEKSFSIIYKQLEIPPESIKRVFSPNDSLITISIEVPKGTPMESIIWNFSSAIKKAGYDIKESIYITDEKGSTLYAVPRSPGPPKYRLTINRGKIYYSKTAKVAILVEDFKFSADQTSIDFLSFPQPLSVSMVGEKKLATWTAQIADEYQKEILILLPMEPLPKSLSDYKASAIMVHYSDETILSMVRKAAESIPAFAGFCNLQGSRILEDTRVMSLVCQEISRLKGYLIISPESRKSVASTVANSIGLPHREIDFSFNTNQPESTLVDSLRHCAIVAQKMGSLLVRGKSSPSFIKALNECIQVFHHNGVRFVYVSDLVEGAEKKKSEYIEKSAYE